MFDRDVKVLKLLLLYCISENARFYPRCCWIVLEVPVIIIDFILDAAGLS